MTRIDTLRLVSFGPFDAREIDLSGPGLHLIVGDNGAGKSTTRRALTGLLFGIDDPADRWRLPAGAPLIVEGVLLGDTGTSLELRRKRTQNRSRKIFTPDDKAIDESAIVPFLHGFSAPSYEALFSLDAAEIEDGGQSLLNGSGGSDAVFAASTGIRAVAAIPERLGAEAAEIFTGRGSKQELAVALTEASRLEQEMKALAVNANDWKKLTDDCARLEEEAHARAQDAVHARAVHERLSRLQAIAGDVARRDALLEELSVLADAPRIDPAESSRERTAATKMIEDLEIELREIGQGKRVNADKRAAISPTLSEDLARLGSRRSWLDERIGEAKSLVEDLPKREARLKDLTSLALARLRELEPAAESLERAGELIPPSARLTTLGRLIEERQRIDEATGARRNALESALADLGDQSADLGADDEKPGIGSLEDERERITSLGPIEQTLSAEAADVDSKLDEARMLAGELPLVDSDMGPEAIAGLMVPLVATVEMHVQAMRSITELQESARKRLDEAESGKADAEAELGRLEQEGVISPEDVRTARSERDSAWQSIRGAFVEGADLPIGSPEEAAAAYESDVDKADRLGDRLLADAEGGARRTELLRIVQKADAAIRENNQELHRLTEQLDAAQEAWVGEWRAAGLDPLSPSEMLDWLERRDQVVSAWRSHLELAAKRDSTTATIESLRNALSLAFTHAGFEPLGDAEPLASALERAKREVTTEREASTVRQNRRSAVKASERAVETARSALSAEAARLEKWQAEWATALVGANLPPDMGVEEAAAALETLKALITSRNEIESFAERVGSIVTGLDLFKSDLRQLCEQGAFTPGQDIDEAPIPAAQELSAAIELASKASGANAGLNENLALLEANELEVRAGIGRAQATLDRLVADAGLKSPEELPEVEARATRRDELEAELKEVETRIVHVGQSNIDALVEDVKAEDAGALAAKVEDADAEAKLRAEERDSANQALGAARKTRDSVDSSSRLAELASDREGQLAVAASLAERWARLKIMEIAVGRAIKRMLDENQRPIIKRASGIFATLTDGAFTGIAVDEEDLISGSNDALWAVADSRETRAADLSDGERDSLYLALRIAGIEEHLASGTVLPVIIDDALVNLDDTRAVGALHALAELAESTQVIILTHHEHMLELAKSALAAGGFKVTRLD